ncbi:hypothetical protein WN48_02725 [Eufriesea mexicana]|uniref:Uncharacterized protein n=1 Tax=Eufriesea mexicana TaxID=516756 RepID=A0A310SL77_9HYME|nr:hypothetical protein WN48_02725 [Eufriesea mexicana]
MALRLAASHENSPQGAFCMSLEHSRVLCQSDVRVLAVMECLCCSTRSVRFQISQGISLSYELIACMLSN